MSEQSNNTNVQNQNGTWQDPIAADTAKPAKKKSSVADIVATVGAFALVYLFGLIGALICYGAYWAVRAVVKSRMNMAVKVILSIVIILAALVLMAIFIMFAASLQA